MAKKLIEVALPLEAINAESAREKSIRHGHPSTLHLWWARRPLATARAVIWSSLVDDPSSHPELFPTEEAQHKERERLFAILTRLVKWENSNNEHILEEAKAEIMKSTGGNPPELLDPFAGGGAIPLEAQRLGLKAHAHDLNPVAVTINRAMIELPAKFTGMLPVNPKMQNNKYDAVKRLRAAGLAEDVEYYGVMLKNEVWNSVEAMYPKATFSPGYGKKEGTIIAWIWARIVKCPNPACGCQIPLVSSYDLSKRKGHEAYAEPIVNGNVVDFIVHTGINPNPKSPKIGRGATFVCPSCGEVTTDAYVKTEAKASRIGSKMMAIVAEGEHGRAYLTPTEEQIKAANVTAPDDCPDAPLPGNPRWFSPPAFGFYTYASLFTNRQLLTLTSLTSQLEGIQDAVYHDALAAGFSSDDSNETGAMAYSVAVRTYLAFVIDKLSDYCSTICSWHTSKELVRNTFGRQAIPMTWDYVETNPFSNSSGCFDNMLDWVKEALQEFPAGELGEVSQFDAQSDCGLRNIMVSTDPPYYDNIGYADLSDFFYIWLRKSLRKCYPKDFSTMVVPKAEELVATPYRFEGGMSEAKSFFENGMSDTCKSIAKYASNDIPVTIYYAFKQSETNETEQTASSGWETMLSAIISAGFSITGTWPMRTEMANRAVGNGTNALASSIVLVCRKRDENARVCTKREFVTQLKSEFKIALSELKSANIAPVDLAQSAIGPGIGVFSRYSQVLESDGTPMTVRTALYIINDEIDAYFNAQDASLDRDSRFCVELYTQAAFNEIKFGDADILARAKNTSVGNLVSEGLLKAEKGNVRLLTREEMPEYKGIISAPRWLLAQQLTYAMSTGGISACAAIVADLMGAEAEDAKDFAYRLFTIADKKGRSQEAYEYNSLIVAWQDITSKATEIKSNVPVQMTFD